MLKIKFVDFWPGFDSSNNYFYTILGGPDEVELSDNPDILFFSNFGNEHKNYKCYRVFFSSENERPNYFITDIALTFDFSNNKNHFRLPLYVLYAHQYKVNPYTLSKKLTQQELSQWKKRKFCCFVVSNGQSKERVNFFNFLSSKEKVDSGGKFLNNVGGPVTDKLSFIKDYKFVISFENSSYPGYTTEKILEPMLVNSIPVYWGNPLVYNDFNYRTYINVQSIEHYNAVYQKMKEIESSDELILQYLQDSKLINTNSFLNTTSVKNFIIDHYTNHSVPNANKLINKIIGFAIEKLNSVYYWIRYYTVGHFR
jgi:hypothetical protein